MNEKPPVPALMQAMGRKARAAFGELGRCHGAMRNLALAHAADAIRDAASGILESNRKDLEAARGKNLSAALLDRLALDDTRLEATAAGLDAIARLPDPLGVIESEWERPNGLRIQRVRVALGVIGIIYESRPNVTVDAAGLCIKSGNCVILRGGSESFHSNRALYDAMPEGFARAGLPPNVVQIVPVTDRAAVGYLLGSMAGDVDVIVPRGGKNLIERVRQDARVPVIGHLEGICHVYVHEAADPDKAVAIVRNAKLRRTGICGAAETLLIDSAAAPRLLPALAAALDGCEIRGDDRVLHLLPSARAAVESDWSTEYLDAIISVRVVDGIDAAIAHIAGFGSGHTECIVTEDQAAADDFLARVDSAIVLHNASTQFADGGEFGMGAEIGIATGRIHARGPVGAEQLTSYKYVVRGDGQVRPE